MKTRLGTICAALLTLLIVWCLLQYHAGLSRKSKLSEPVRPKFIHTNAKNQSDRSRELEREGELPEGDTKYDDWQLAQHTSWWGKALDAKKFWRGRVLWNDAKATLDAQRHGRLYPPIPYAVTNLPPFPNDEAVHGTYMPDSPNIFYAYSSEEAAFWDQFDKINPRPPNQIQQQQEWTAQRFFAGGEREFLRTEPIGQNYPPEAFSKGSLFWAYVEMKRGEYQRELDSEGSKNKQGFQLFMSNFLNNLLVESKYITDPLSPGEIQAANAWQIAYLRRLRLQNTDFQYINAYLQAWNLSSNDVFTPGN